MGFCLNQNRMIIRTKEDVTQFYLNLFLISCYLSVLLSLKGNCTPLFQPTVLVSIVDVTDITNTQGNIPKNLSFTVLKCDFSWLYRFITRS